MRRASLRIAGELVLGVALVVSVGLILRQSRQVAAYRRQQDRDLQALRDLREALRQRDLQKTPVVSEGPTSAGDQRTALAQRDATIGQLNHELSQARTNITDLQARLSDSNDERQNAVASLNGRYEKEKDDWQERLDALQKELDSAQAESQATRERIVALEAANDKFKSDNKEATTRAAELERAAASLQDLDRRRDAYLTSILRQYRDITSQFRAMSGMLDSGRDPNSGTFSSAALTRIQNAISQADDDLRQLSELNAQTRQLEKKLEKK